MCGGKLSELLAVDHRLAVLVGVEQRDRPFGDGERALEQGNDRCDPASARKQEQRGPRSGRGVENETALGHTCDDRIAGLQVVDQPIRDPPAFDSFHADFQGFSEIWATRQRVAAGDCEVVPGKLESEVLACLVAICLLELFGHRELEGSTLRRLANHCGDPELVKGNAHGASSRPAAASADARCSVLQ